jgi:hypothetical protein
MMMQRERTNGSGVAENQINNALQQQLAALRKARRAVPTREHT